MRLEIIPKPKLSGARNRLLMARLAAPEHAEDKGPPTVWDKFTAPNQVETLYAFFHKQEKCPIGIAEASGIPVTTAGWWIDSTYRGQKYGNDLVDLLADHLKLKGVTGVGRLLVATNRGACDDASFALARRFRAHFDI